MDPDTRRWLAVSRERAADAKAMLPQRTGSAGPVYMAGYAVECALKGYLQYHDLPLPPRGREGHDLRGLWKKAGFRLADLKDARGSKTFFVENWSTDLRYQDQPDIELDMEELIDGARRLSGWIQKQMRRRKGRRR